MDAPDNFELIALGIGRALRGGEVVAPVSSTIPKPRLSPPSAR